VKVISEKLTANCRLLSGHSAPEKTPA